MIYNIFRAIFFITVTEGLLCLKFKNHRNFMVMKLLDLSILFKDILNKGKVWYINYFDLKDNIELKYIKNGKELDKNNKQDKNILILRNINNIKNENDETYNNYCLVYNNNTYEPIKNEALIENIEYYKCNYSLLVMSVIFDNNEKYILDLNSPCLYIMENNNIDNNLLNYYLNMTHNVGLTDKYTINIMTNKMETFNYDESKYIIFKKDNVCLNKY